jgi:ABC-type bacteriocin/lantibiotic exporter with double-glycine peptidase domain
MTFKSLLILFDRVFHNGLRKNKLNILLVLLLTIVASVWGIIAPYLLQSFIDNAVPGKNMTLMLYYFLGFAGSMTLFAIFWAIQISVATKLACNLFYELRLSLVETVLQKPIGFFQEFKTADIISRIMNDLDFMENFFYNNIISGATFLVFCLLMFIFIVLWNWKLGSILCISMLVYFIFLSLLYKPVFNYSRKAREDLAEQNEVVLDLINGSREIKIFQQSANAIERLNQKALLYWKTNRKFLRYSDVIFIISEALGFFVSALPVFIGGFLLAQDDKSLTVGTPIAYYALSSVLLSNFRFSLEGLNKIYQCSAPLIRIKELQDKPEERIAIQSLDEIPANTVIEFKNISFHYKQGKEILKNFNLIIRENEKIAIVGKSGSGKSTLLNLLIGFVQPDAGQVLFGGKEISQYSRGVYFNYFSYITQWNHIFKISIKDNMSMGWYNVPIDDIKNAAALLKLDKVIESFPEKYDTVIGSDRVTLSGGEQQRIAFARALIRDPKVLLLDEITAALDKNTERELIADVFNLFADKTIICVTHSKELALNFDRIIEL